MGCAMVLRVSVPAATRSNRPAGYILAASGAVTWEDPLPSADPRPIARQAPAATSRPKAHHCEYDPGYSARSSPAVAPASTSRQAVTPDPQ